MKNREKLMKAAAYDTLTRMNENLQSRKRADLLICVMDALGEKDRNSRCEKHCDNCGNCIAAWLNEEERK